MLLKLFRGEFWSRIRSAPWFHRAGQILQRLLVLGILVLIIWQMSGIGWSEVLRSLPTHPLFYLLFFLAYFNLPAAEVLIYRNIWPVGRLEAFKAFITKMVYNHEVMGYSGEFSLFLWARKKVQKEDREIFKNIRDMSILSAITSGSVALLLLAVLLYAGILDVSHFVEDTRLIHIFAGVVIVLVLIMVGIRFRSYLFALPRKMALLILGIYHVRFLGHHVLLLCMWAVAVPEVSWTVWFTFLALHIVVNRIPFLPSKDLMFLWTGVELARGLDVSLASLAGMFLVYSALKKIVNLGFYLLIHYYWSDPAIANMKEKPPVEPG